MKNILITGGLGFIGFNLAKKLAKNYKVYVLDINERHKDYKNINNIHFIQTDINNFDFIKSLLDSVEFSGIIHLAAISRVVVAQNNPKECVRTNIEGTKTLLKALELSKTQKNKPWLIFGSSREVYGEPKKMPVKEDFEKKPINIYGESKIKGEKLFTEFAKNYYNNCLILRFSNVYGNNYDLIDRVVPKFITSIYLNKEITIEGGNQIIDFTYIDDVIKTIEKAILYLENNNKVLDDIHILPGIGWNLFQLIENIEKIMNKKAKIKINPKRNYDVEKFIGDPSKVKSLLNIDKFLTLEEGLKLAVKNYTKDLK